MGAIHEKKNRDYSELENAYSNFEYSAKVAAQFTNIIDRVFAVLVSTKMARIAELTKPGKIPNNESLDDSYLDMAVYAAIWASYNIGRKSLENVPFALSIPWPNKLYKKEPTYINKLKNLSQRDREFKINGNWKQDLKPVRKSK